MQASLPNSDLYLVKYLSPLSQYIIGKTARIAQQHTHNMQLINAKPQYNNLSKLKKFLPKENERPPRI